MRDTERAAGVVGAEFPLLTAVRTAAEELRPIVNRFVVRGVLATSGIAAALLHRLLPERHPFLPDHGTLWELAKLQSGVLARLCGVAVTVQGRERLSAGPYVFVANHQSYFDLVVLLAALPGRIRFLATDEMTCHLFWGPILRAAGIGSVDADAETPEAVVEKLARMTADGSVLVFPEGRRGSTTSLLPFADLPFMAIIGLGLPVVPIAIHGTGGVMPATGASGVWPGEVRVVVEEPIPTAHLLAEDYHPLREDVRALIARQVEEVGALLVGDADGADFPDKHAQPEGTALERGFATVGLAAHA
jgi:1-acyl-sn-glycerol-3-phosphate acyltransferase